MVDAMTPAQLISFRASLPNEDRDKFDCWYFERSWQVWLGGMFPRTMYDFAQHHHELWQWLWEMPAVAPDPFVAIWPRGGAKSTNAELGVVMLGCLGKRNYCLYVCQTQEQADDHVANIQALLENATLERIYPQMSEPLMNKFGDPKGWRRNRLRTAAGFTVDAMGLDSSARGAKVDDFRPDVMVFDDIDSEIDSPASTEKKIQQITRKLLPAGAWNCSVLFVQNLVHENSIFSRLAGISQEKADFLQDRIVSGPFPALLDAAYEQDNDGKWHIVTGTPTWNGQSLERCQALMSRIGYTAFRVECQQEVDALPGGMFDHISFKHCTWAEIAPLVRISVWVDPATTSTDHSDSQALQVDGQGADGKIYRLYSWEQRATPVEAIKKAIEMCVLFKCGVLGIETDTGGETWSSVFNEAMRAYVEETGNHVSIALIENKTTTGHGPKVYRASQQLAAYEQGTFVHLLGTHEILEKALRRFPRMKPYDLVDASYWTWFDLCGTEPFASAVGGIASPMTTFQMR